MKREFIVAVSVLFVLAAGCGGPGDASEEGDEATGDPSGHPSDDPVDEDGVRDDEPSTLAATTASAIRRPVSGPN